MFRILLILIMAFPTIENSTSQQFNTSSRTHDFDIPAGWTINAGDLLLLIFESFENASLTNEVPTGWTSLRFVNDEQQILNSVYKSADGDEAGTTVTFAISDDPADTEAAAAVMIHFSGWSSIEDSGNLYNEFNTSDIDPPSISPSWGADDNAYIAVGAQRGNNGTVSAWPTNYTDVQEEVNHGAGAEQDGMLAVAVRTVNNGTEDPGSFTFSTTQSSLALTFAVQPEGGQTITMDKGTFSLTGYDLFTNQQVVLDKGGFTLSGYDLALNQSMILDSGQFTVSGYPIALNANVVLDKGTFTLTGYDLDFVSGGASITLDKGTFSVTGYDLAFNRTVPLDKGTFSVDGKTLSFNVSIPVNKGSFSLTGYDLNYKSVVPLDKGTFLVTGYDLAFSTTDNLVILTLQSTITTDIELDSNISDVEGDSTIGDVELDSLL